MARSAPVPMIKLTSVQGQFAAHVLAARLTDEGIDVQLRGALANPYGLTVGDFARVDLYVPTDQVDDASFVLLVSEVDDALELPPPRRTPGIAWRGMVAIVVLCAALMPLAARILDRG